MKKENSLIFYEEIKQRLKKIFDTQHIKFREIAKLFFETYKKDGMIYIFGTGHSHMMAEEGHFRAGGFAPICPILSSDLMLHKSAIQSSVVERTEGVSKMLLKKYNICNNDILMIFSNSGVNQAPVEAAVYGKEICCTVISVVSYEYSKVAPLSKIGKKLIEISDYYIDNCGPIGDALVKIENQCNVSSFSTISGSFILNSILSEVADLSKNEIPFPFYISANIPKSKNNNNFLFQKYKKRNPHL